MYEIIQKMQAYDPCLPTHCIHVAQLAVNVGSSLGLNTKQLYTLKIAALIHDIGKIFIDRDVLMKPGSLTPDERKLVDMHSLIGYFSARAAGFPLDVSEIILLHHGNKNFPVPYSELNKVLADILRACDIFDAVTHDRPYHHKVSYLEGMQIVRMQTDLSERILSALDKCVKSLSA